MKLTTIMTEGRAVPAALLTSGSLVDLVAASGAGMLGKAPLRDLSEVVDLDGPHYGVVRDLVDKLEGGDSVGLERLAALGALHDPHTAVYAPILRPGLIFACGMAYNEHNQEMDVGPPPSPTGFMKSPNAIIGHKAPIILPASNPDTVDYECELGVVIGRPLYNVSPEEALACVAGFTMINEVGARTVVPAFLKAMKGSDPLEYMRLYNENMLLKQLPTFCPMGPVIETADSFGDVSEFSVETRLNGEVMQSAHSSDLIFPIAYSLSYFSRWYRFMPGDVLSTGSPAGVGFARNPQRMLRPGDVVEVSCPKIGALSNPVVAA
jgi:2-keto-4-pentenoate hydratase/2-oxohepta-3-ene-1,7-dioic acid hydratase in catechol pathway